MHQKKQLNWMPKWICVCLALLLAFTPLQMAAAAVQYPDIPGHWAEKTLTQGVEDGLVIGTNGRMNPNQNITLPEVLTILNRVLATKKTGNISAYKIPQTAWYYNEVARSQALGLLSGLSGTPSFTKALPRGDTFVVLVEAFQLMDTEPDVSCLSAFKDANALTNQNRAATAVLVKLGVVKGAGGLLMSTKPVTRAEFLEMLYRVIGTVKRADQVSSENTGNLILSPNVPESPEPTQSPEPSVTPTPAPTPTPTPAPTPTPDVTESPAPTPTPDVTESPAPTPTPDVTESPAPTPTPDVTESPVPTPTPDENRKAEETAGPALLAPAEETDGNTAVIKDLKTANRVIFNSDCHTITLDNVQASGDVVVRADQLKGLNLTNGTTVKRLTIASVSGDLTVAPSEGSRIDVLRVGTGSGTITVSGNVGAIEITGSSRYVVLRDTSVSGITISGQNNRVGIFNTASVGALKTCQQGEHSRIVVEGTVASMTLNGKDSQVGGSGTVNSVLITGAGSAVSAKAGKITQTIDRLLTEMKLTFQTPAKVTPGGTLKVTAKFNNVGLDKVCSIQWYRDGVAVSGQSNSAFTVKEGGTVSYSPPITFTKNMKTSITVGLSVTYKSGTRVDTVYKTVTVPIENYPLSHYYGSEAQRVFNLVSCKYTGKRSDYTAADKEIFVNAKGYSSPSKYLIWVNLATQRVNIFQGSKGNWRIIRSSQVGTGKASTPTPVGVFYVTRKQTGWFTPTYTVKPVVRFSAGSGYAFHSILYNPNGTLQDGRVGVPVSHGCVRMYSPDIQWLYDNVPIGTTVVVY